MLKFSGGVDVQKSCMFKVMGWSEERQPCRGDRGTLGHGAQWDNGISWETPDGGILKILSHDLRDTPVAILFS